MKKRLVGISLLLIAVVLAVLLFFYAFQSYRHSNYLELLGNVDIRDVNLSFRVGGRIAHLYVDEGDYVKAGMLIGQLDPDPFQRELNEANASVQSQTSAEALERLIFERNKSLFLSSAGSRSSFEDALEKVNQAKHNLERAQAIQTVTALRLQDTQLFAPSNGVILTRVHEEGSVVAQGDPVFNMAIESPVWIRAYIDEPKLNCIYPGMNAKIVTDSNKVYYGKIGFISPQAEFTPKTVETQTLRTDLVYRLRIVVNTPDKYLRQGMPVTIYLQENPKDVKASSC